MQRASRELEVVIVCHKAGSQVHNRSPCRNNDAFFSGSFRKVDTQKQVKQWERTKIDVAEDHGETETLDPIQCPGVCEFLAKAMILFVLKPRRVSERRYTEVS